VGGQQNSPFRGEIVSGACNQADASTIAAGQNAEAVMLDFVIQPGPKGGALVHQLKQHGDPWRLSEELPPPSKGHST
jgi:hypothetical protein